MGSFLIFVIFVIMAVVGFRNLPEKNENTKDCENTYQKAEEKRKKKRKERAKNEEVVKTYVTGTRYRQKEINKVVKYERKFIDKYFGLTNKEIIDDGYDEVWEFDESTPFGEVKLEHEPENKYDKFAIKVLLKSADDKYEHVGYLPKSITNDEKYGNGTIIGTNIYLNGGKYKYVEFEGDKEKVYIDETDYSLKIDIIFKSDSLIN